MDIHSPSGHVAAATVVSGGLAMLLLRRRLSVLPIAALAGVVIGVSRLMLGVHSLPEVVLGAIVGLAGAAALVHLAGPVPRIKVTPLVGAVAIVAVLFHGTHLRAETEIRFVAWRMAQVFSVCRPQNAHLPASLHVHASAAWR